MVDGTLLKVTESQVTQLTKAIARLEANATATNTSLEQLTAIMAAWQQNSSKDSSKQPFQVRNVKLEFPRFDGRRPGMDIQARTIFRLLRHAGLGLSYNCCCTHGPLHDPLVSNDATQSAISFLVVLDSGH